MAEVIQTKTTPPAQQHEDSQSILLLGNPNSGKSLIFNRLTGLTQKVSNFPGVTTELLQGRGKDFNFIDFPGIYSLQALTEDEKVTVEGIKKHVKDGTVKAIVYVLDSTRLERSLLLLLQLNELLSGFPIVVAANVIDEVISKGAHLDTEGLGKELQLPVFPVSAKTKSGISELEAALKDLKVNTFEVKSLDEHEQPYKDECKRLSSQYGPQEDVILKSQNRLDKFFLSSLFGPLSFFMLMAFLFQAIFTWASPLMDLVENVIVAFGEHISTYLPSGLITDFFQDAIIGGIGSFLVFAPQIFILFLIIGTLEDSGYLSRAAILCHRPLSWFGLSGRSFVPLLSGHACAVPAMMAARTIVSRRSRLLTIIATPLMACSARLPVYALLIGGFVPAVEYAGGLFGLQGLFFFGLYALGIVAGLLVSALTNTAIKGRCEDAPFIVELPPYRIPGIKPILQQAWQKTWTFIKKAGTIIFTVTVVIWILGYFPNNGELDQSFLATFGKVIEPALEPIGLDWKIGVAILTSFLAREVFVGTLGTMYGIEAADENIATLTQALQQNPNFTMATAVALLIFYALAMQCVSTLAVMKKETGGYKIPVFVFFAFSLLAYVAAMIAFHLIH